MNCCHSDGRGHKNIIFAHFYVDCADDLLQSAEKLNAFANKTA